MLFNRITSFVNNVTGDLVLPVEGSIVYCELASGAIEHTGIYVGNNRIIHLNNNGSIEKVSPRIFLNSSDELASSIRIYISCDGTTPVGGSIIAKRAKKMINSRMDYSLFLNNCHQFVSGCLTGNFENPENYFHILENTAHSAINANAWQVWDR